MRLLFLLPLLAVFFPDRAVLGVPAEMPPPKILHAGPISARFVDGELRYIHAGGREIARRIYVAVRDDKWGTAKPEFTRVDLQQEDDAFTVKLEADCRSGAVDYTWKGTITGTAAGEITFSVDGVANADFRSNRIGLCLLFGADALAGQAFKTSDESGDVTPGEFPKLVSPKLLATNFRELRYATPELMEVNARLTGSLFSMEDQRNYCDSSYKAFAPLSYDYPEIHRGAPARQELTLTVFGAQQEAKPQDGVRLKIGAAIPGAKIPKVKEVATTLDVPSFEAINTHRDKFAGSKALSFRYDPTNHLRDDDTLMENVSALVDQVRTIRSFAPDAVISVGPIGFEPAPGSSVVETRTESPFGAAWSAEVLRTLSLAGVEEAAFAVPGNPARKIQQEIGHHCGASVIETTVTADGPFRAPVGALCIEEKGKRILWLINLTADIQEVTFDRPESPLTLQPWEVRDVELTGSN